MIYVYRKNASTGARLLAEALGQGARRFRGTEVPIERKARAGDVVIAWGEAVPEIRGVRVLNGTTIRNKFSDAELLAREGVPTIQVSLQRPAAPPPVAAAVDPAIAIMRDAQEAAEELVNLTLPAGPLPRRGPLVDGVRDLLAKLNGLTGALAIAAPVAQPGRPVGEWLSRSNSHVGGNDLLANRGGDYYAKKEDLVQEVRVHSFKGRSLRAGVKALREGFSLDGANGTRRAHAWIRSWDGGWRILYDGQTSRQAHRDLAHEAVEALGLDFGAVDIGEKRDGSLIVLEVNRAPGLEGGSVDVYANAIRQWAQGRE